MICFDTNAVIAMLGGAASPIRGRFEAAVAEGESLAVSTVVLFELWYGVAKSERRPGNARKLEEFEASPIEVLSFDAEDAREAGEIRAALARTGKPIGPYDLVIAAQARRRDATLVTADTREFARVPGLKVEDWSAPSMGAP